MGPSIDSTDKNRTGSRVAFASNPISRSRRLAIAGIGLIAIGVLIYVDSWLGGDILLPEQEQGQPLNYGLLFLAGLLSGFHCVGMCGALVVSFTMNAAKVGRPTIASQWLYAAGKTLSYTVIGGLFGAVGSIVAFTPFMRGVAGLAAGLFLVIFGLGMLNVFPRLSRFRIKTPRVLTRFVSTSYKKYQHPFVIGLLNGLMVICGPLQAMYVLAAGTGSPLEGATMLLVFGLGTLPLMLGFGFLTNTVSKQLAPRLLKASGFVVIALGCVMLNRGLIISGSGYDVFSLTTASAAQDAVVEFATNDPVAPQVVYMTVKADEYRPNRFTLTEGVPVKWVVHAAELNGCNKRILVPALGLAFDIQPGENVFEFTPQGAGEIRWSCWMGMIPGSFQVETSHAPLTTAHK